jgi:hypothetical protein
MTKYLVFLLVSLPAPSLEISTGYIVDPDGRRAEYRKDRNDKEWDDGDVWRLWKYMEDNPPALPVIRKLYRNGRLIQVIYPGHRGPR